MPPKEYDYELYKQSQQPFQIPQGLGEPLPLLGGGNQLAPAKPPTEEDIEAQKKITGDRTPREQREQSEAYWKKEDAIDAQIDNLLAMGAGYGRNLYSSQAPETIKEEALTPEQQKAARQRHAERSVGTFEKGEARRYGEDVWEFDQRGGGVSKGMNPVFGDWDELPASEKMELAFDTVEEGMTKDEDYKGAIETNLGQGIAKRIPFIGGAIEMGEALDSWNRAQRIVDDTASQKDYEELAKQFKNAAYWDEEAGWGEKAVANITQILTYGAEFAMTGGGSTAAGAAKAGAKKTAQEVTEQMLKKTGVKELMKRAAAHTGRTALDTAKRYPAMGITRAVGDYHREQQGVGDLEITKDGSYKFGEEDDSPTRQAFESALGSYVELAVENLLPDIGKGTLSKFATKNKDKVRGKIADFFVSASETGTGKALNKAQIGGLLTEIGEERLTEVANALVTGEADKLGVTGQVGQGMGGDMEALKEGLSGLWDEIVAIGGLRLGAGTLNKFAGGGRNFRDPQSKTPRSPDDIPGERSEEEEIQLEQRKAEAIDKITLDLMDTQSAKDALLEQSRQNKIELKPGQRAEIDMMDTPSARSAVPVAPPVIEDIEAPPIIKQVNPNIITDETVEPVPAESVWPPGHPLSRESSGYIGADGTPVRTGQAQPSTKADDLVETVKANQASVRTRWTLVEEITGNDPQKIKQIRDAVEAGELQIAFDEDGKVAISVVGQHRHLNVIWPPHRNETERENRVTRSDEWYDIEDNNPELFEKLSKIREAVPNQWERGQITQALEQMLEVAKGTPLESVIREQLKPDPIYDALNDLWVREETKAKPKPKPKPTLTPDELRASLAEGNRKIAEQEAAAQEPTEEEEADKVQEEMYSDPARRIWVDEDYREAAKELVRKGASSRRAFSKVGFDDKTLGSMFPKGSDRKRLLNSLERELNSFDRRGGKIPTPDRDFQPALQKQIDKEKREQEQELERKSAAIAAKLKETIARQKVAKIPTGQRQLEKSQQARMEGSVQPQPQQTKETEVDESQKPAGLEWWQRKDLRDRIEKDKREQKKKSDNVSDVISVADPVDDGGLSQQAKDVADFERVFEINQPKPEVDEGKEYTKKYKSNFKKIGSYLTKDLPIEDSRFKNESYDVVDKRLRKLEETRDDIPEANYDSNWDEEKKADALDDRINALAESFMPENLKGKKPAAKAKKAKDSLPNDIKTARQDVLRELDRYNKSTSRKQKKQAYDNIRKLQSKFADKGVVPEELQTSELKPPGRAKVTSVNKDKAKEHLGKLKDKFKQSDTPYKKQKVYKDYSRFVDEWKAENNGEIPADLVTEEIYSTQEELDAIAKEKSDKRTAKRTKKEVRSLLKSAKQAVDKAKKTKTKVTPEVKEQIDEAIEEAQVEDLTPAQEEAAEEIANEKIAFEGKTEEQAYQEAVEEVIEEQVVEPTIKLKEYSEDVVSVRNRDDAVPIDTTEDGVKIFSPSQENKWSEGVDVGWKFHLNVKPENLESVYEVLDELGLFWKGIRIGTNTKLKVVDDKLWVPKKGYAYGWHNTDSPKNNWENAEGKPITVYGTYEKDGDRKGRRGMSRDFAMDIAKKINDKVGDKIEPAAHSVLKDDAPLLGNIWARFDIKADSELLFPGYEVQTNPLAKKRFARYGGKGIQNIRHHFDMRWQEGKYAEGMKLAHGLLTDQFGTYFQGTGKNKFENPYAEPGAKAKPEPVKKKLSSKRGDPVVPEKRERTQLKGKQAIADLKALNEDLGDYTVLGEDGEDMPGTAIQVVKVRGGVELIIPEASDMKLREGESPYIKGGLKKRGETREEFLKRFGGLIESKIEEKTDAKELQTMEEAQQKIKENSAEMHKENATGSVQDDIAKKGGRKSSVSKSDTKEVSEFIDDAIEDSESLEPHVVNLVTVSEGDTYFVPEYLDAIGTRDSQKTYNKYIRNRYAIDLARKGKAQDLSKIPNDDADRAKKAKEIIFEKLMFELSIKRGLEVGNAFFRPKRLRKLLNKIGFGEISEQAFIDDIPLKASEMLAKAGELSRRFDNMFFDSHNNRLIKNDGTYSLQWVYDPKSVAGRVEEGGPVFGNGVPATLPYRGEILTKLTPEEFANTNWVDIPSSVKQELNTAKKDAELGVNTSDRIREIHFAEVKNYIGFSRKKKDTKENLSREEIEEQYAEEALANKMRSSVPYRVMISSPQMKKFFSEEIKTFHTKRTERFNVDSEKNPPSPYQTLNDLDRLFSPGDSLHERLVPRHLRLNEKKIKKFARGFRVTRTTRGWRVHTPHGTLRIEYANSLPFMTEKEAKRYEGQKGVDVDKIQQVQPMGMYITGKDGKKSSVDSLGVIVLNNDPYSMANMTTLMEEMFHCADVMGFIPMHVRRKLVKKYSAENKDFATQSEDIALALNKMYKTDLMPIIGHLKKFMRAVMDMFGITPSLERKLLDQIKTGTVFNVSKQQRNEEMKRLSNAKEKFYSTAANRIRNRHKKKVRNRQSGRMVDPQSDFEVDDANRKVNSPRRNQWAKNRDYRPDAAVQQEALNMVDSDFEGTVTRLADLMQREIQRGMTDADIKAMQIVNEKLQAEARKNPGDADLQVWATEFNEAYMKLGTLHGRHLRARRNPHISQEELIRAKVRSIVDRPSKDLLNKLKKAMEWEGLDPDKVTLPADFTGEIHISSRGLPAGVQGTGAASSGQGKQGVGASAGRAGTGGRTSPGNAQTKVGRGAAVRGSRAGQASGASGSRGRRTTPPTIPSSNRGKSNKVQEILKAIAEESKKRKDYLRSQGFDLSERGLNKIRQNPIRLAELIDHAAWSRATQGEKVFSWIKHWYYNSILSGIRTHVTNIVGNTLYNGFRRAEKMVGRGLFFSWGDTSKVDESLLGEDYAAFKNFISKNPEAVADINSFMGSAMANAMATMRTNVSVLDSKRLDEGSDWWAREQGLNLSPKGALADIVGIPTRALKAGDDFFRSLAMNQMAGACAAAQARLARQRGEIGTSRGEFDAFVMEQLQNPLSKSWEMGNELAREYVHQEDRPSVEVINNVSGVFAKWFKNHPNVGAFADLCFRLFALPFRRTPTNLLAKGISRSPLGIPILTMKVMHNLREGKHAFNGIEGEAATALFSSLLLLAAMAWDDDEEAGVSFGPVGWTGSKEGRDWRQKRFGYSPGIKGENTAWIGGKQFEYANVEPWASILSITADLATGDGLEVIKSPLSQVKGRSYFQGAERVMRVVEGDSEYVLGMMLADSLATFAVPNLVRQIDRETKNHVRSKTSDTYTERFTKQLELPDWVVKTFGGDIPPPVIDNWGRVAGNEWQEAHQGTGQSIAGKGLNIVTPMIKWQGDTEAFRGDKIFERYNLQNKENTYPTELLGGIKKRSFSSAGKTYRLNPGQAAYFNHYAGGISYTVADRMVPDYAVKTPNKYHMEMVKKIQSLGQAPVKEAYLQGRMFELDSEKESIDVENKVLKWLYDGSRNWDNPDRANTFKGLLEWYRTGTR